MNVRLEGAEGRPRSDLEEDFFALVRVYHFPPPETNVKLGRWEVDFLWRSHRLVVEIDSFLYRHASVAFHDDHARDLDLRQLGFTVLRFSDRQLEEEPARVVADLGGLWGRALLGVSGGRRGRCRGRLPASCRRCRAG